MRDFVVFSMQQIVLVCKSEEFKEKTRLLGVEVTEHVKLNPRCVCVFVCCVGGWVKWLCLKCITD